MSAVASPLPPTSASRRPREGEIVHVRSRNYVVDQLDTQSGTPVARLACLDDDAQGQMIDVVWDLELDTKIIDQEAWRSLGERGFDDPRLFSAYVNTLRWNCVTATDPKLFQSPFRAGIRIDAYQLEPLKKALLLPRVNLFIADDVGLGKTIEAGLIANELLLRRRVREIVVACPPSMLYQWKDELENRFGLTFEILDREYVDRVRRERGFAVNPWCTFPRLLVSHRLLIDEAYAAPLRDWLDNFRPGTLLILDEAHHAAPASGSKYAIDSRITRAVRDLAGRFEHRLFLSATPHNGHSNSFSALLELLDPQRFTRGVKVLKSNLDSVMVRRLKDDIREISGGFPKRVVKQIDIAGLPEDAPELKLSRLLNDYRDVRQLRVAESTKRQQAEAALVASHLQQRLLSSVEAFARTLAVHRRTMERVWSGESSTAKLRSQTTSLLSNGIEADDDQAQLSEDEQQELLNSALIDATTRTSGNGNVPQEKVLLDQLQHLAEKARALPDQRVLKFIEWMRKNMCAGVCVPGEGLPERDAKWTDTRVLIFTEYDDTKRYLVEMLRMAIADTYLADHRIEVFHGPTPPEKREAIKRAFNLRPSEHPIRILVATDAAREGLNLQAHCCNIFHFDVPWNPSRLEQRNGRIDRKLQPSPEVFCHYFVYTQRPEDRVLRALVRKTETIRKELGSLAQVLDVRLAETLRGGISHREIGKLEAEINGADLDAEKRATAEEELESTRQRRDALRTEITSLEGRVRDSANWIGLDMDQLRDTLSCSLEILGAEPMKRDAANDGPARYVLPNLETRRGADPTWAATVDTLRKPPEDGVKGFEWRKDSPIRPVVFEAPEGIDDDVVQLHLQHRVVQRLLGRFSAQGFVYHDLSRACLAQSSDNVARVVLLGRLSLYGHRATRLHEELVSVTARWSVPQSRRGALTPYARDTESKTLELLEQSLKPSRRATVAESVTKQLRESLARDIQELLPHLETRAGEFRADAVAALAERGRAESDSIRKILEDQRRRVQTEMGRYADDQLVLGFSEPEKRQLDANKRYWQRWLANVEGDLKDEPARIASFYQVASTRIEPIGIAYLWPVQST